MALSDPTPGVPTSTGTLVGAAMFYWTGSAWAASPAPGAGSVTSVSGAGTVSGLTLTGTVTTTGSLTLGGTLVLTAAQIAAVDLSTLPTADPGGGKMWLNGGVLQVGA